jgi:diguanylate cyclase (GGDEF)-like protein
VAEDLSDSGDSDSTPPKISVQLLSRLQHVVRQYDFDTIFHELADVAAENLGAKGAAFILQEGDLLRYLFFHGLSEGYTTLSSLVFREDQGISGEALRRQEPVYTSDYPHSPWAMPEYVATQLQGSLAMPVHGPNGIIGVLALSWFQVAPLSIAPGDMALTQLFADMLGAAWYRMGIEQHLADIAARDILTGIPNRFHLEERIQTACARADRHERMLAVILIDLDGFKKANDTLGHVAGDRLLCESVSRVHDCLRASDTLIRFAGDEFVILLEDLRRISDLEDILTRIQLALNICMGIDGKNIAISGSQGVSVYPLDDSPAALLLHHADQAVYRAKRNGGNTWCYYDPQEDERIDKQQLLCGELERALQYQELILYWQPIIDLETSRCVGVEALLRWQHPQQGLLMPGVFLKAAEESALMVRMGQWVMRTACLQGEQWARQGLDLQIHINLAARQVENHRLCDDLRRSIGECPQLPTHRICLELVERIALLDLSKTAALIRDCQSMGVKFALDDFGTGPAALQYLLELGCNQIKIDCSFVIPMGTSERHRRMVNAMIQMAQALGVNICAEGIETAEVQELLKHMGAEHGQGFGIARPMPAAEVAAFVTQRNALSNT